MHCPQCGQQQVADDTRFCSRCGFSLTGIAEVMRNGGNIPTVQPQMLMPSEPSPRKKGVKQGVLMLMLAIIVLPVLGIINFPEEIMGLAAVLGFLGGFLRIIYALIFEEGAPKIVYVPTHQRQQTQIQPLYQPPPPTPISSTFTGAALPPPQSQPVSSWRAKNNTAEIVQPPSVTEHTTRILDRDKVPEK